MKKLIYSLPASLFEVFVVEFNGYGFEILNRDQNEVIFAIYSQEEELEGIKEAVEEIFKELGGGSLILEEDIPEENWEEKWKNNIKPVKIPPFIIIPEWEVYAGKDLIPIKIKIGMAFGTGLHPTTQIMLKFISRFVKKGMKVLDVGTGSGILAIASAKLGAEVDAIDIQEEAVKECIENSWENEVKINCEKKSVEQINKKYDVVLANLQIDIFRNVFDKLPELFDRYLIISGIFKNKEKDEIINMAKRNKLKMVEEISQQKEGELWYGFVFEQIH